ncbi:hypothetical protein BC835DRAFT_1356996 [Cytidiella melzeri]|nr:hypothetical protein BC835DRAFT_1356996 [Cytidiella melzeri]
MGELHMQIFCTVCLAWITQTGVEILPCGHVFCLECLLNLRTHGKCQCPTCRASFNARETHKMFMEVRDKRMSKLRKAMVLHTTGEAADFPSSSRPGTPTQLDDDDEIAGYPIRVHLQAAACAQNVEKLDQQTRASTVERVGDELLDLADRMQGKEEDYIKLLLASLAVFMQSVAAPLFDAIAAHAASIAGKCTQIVDLEKQLLNAKRLNKQHAQVLQEAIDTTQKTADENIELKKSLEALREAASENDGLKHSVAHLEYQLKEESAKSKRLESGNQAWAKKDKSHRSKIADLKAELENVRNLVVQQRTQLDLRNSPTPGLVIASDYDYDELRYADRSSQEPKATPPFPRTQSTAEPVSAPGPGVRPTFGSTWNIESNVPRKRKVPDKSRQQFPIKTDSSGRVVGNIQVGPRGKLNRYN